VEIFAHIYDSCCDKEHSHSVAKALLEFETLDAQEIKSVVKKGKLVSKQAEKTQQEMKKQAQLKAIEKEQKFLDELKRQEKAEAIKRLADLKREQQK